MARWLTGTAVTPNQVSAASLVIAVASFVAFWWGNNILGGLLAQVSSVVDGVDGDLARAKGMMSAFGGFFDAVLDRYADAAIILGMTLWSVQHETWPGIWLVGFSAIVGSVMISYSRARAEASTGVSFKLGIVSLASRDVRLFLIMVGSMVGQVYWTMLLLAVFTNFIVLARIIVSWQRLSGENNPID
jgi:phosphatidylglycerophosphate synthase